MITAGGRFVPSPGVDSSPLPASEKRRDRRHNSIVWAGQEYRLPDRAEIRVNGRLRQAWIRQGDMIVTLTEDGPMRLDDDERRLILESWPLL